MENDPLLFSNEINIRKLKPFLKWAGGKTQLLNYIISSIPEKIREAEYFNYVEPFAGSCAVMFKVAGLFFNKLNKIVLNDINENLVNVYKVIKENPLHLIKRLELLKKEYYSLDENNRTKYYYSKRDEYNNTTPAEDDIKKASLLILLNKLCYNGLYRENSKGEFNVPYGKYKNPRIFDEDTVLADSEVLKKVDILNLDYQKTINYLDDAVTLYYLDPPYKPISSTSSFNSYSKFDFDDREQERLKSFCDLLTQKNIYFILSNSDLKNVDKDNQYFDKLYAGYNIKRVNAKRAINSNGGMRGEIYELLIHN